MTPGQGSDTGLSAARLERVTAALDRYIERRQIAGVVSLIARHGHIAHFKAQGVMDLDSQEPMQQSTIFRIASMTKPLTSVAAMMLFEEGYFQLNDPLSKFMPEYRSMRVAVPNTPAPYKTIPAEREITLRHLLTHTAGLPNAWSGFISPEYNALVLSRTREETVGDFSRKLAKLPLHFQPGTAWEYGPATSVLGHVVETISGLTLDEFFSQRILEPLGMTDTHFVLPAEKEARLATCYGPTGMERIARSPLAPSLIYPAGFFSGEGGLHSTAADYIRFAQMLLNGGQLEGTRLLSRKTVELMTTNHIGDLEMWERMAGYRFGLGFSIRADLAASANLGSVGSYGWGGIYGTHFHVDPVEKLIAILMIQLIPNDHINIRADFSTLAAQAIAD